MNLQNQLEYLPTMLDGVTLPSDDLDADLLKSVIVERCGLLEPLYSEPETMQQVISVWFRSHQWNIAHVIDLIKTAYKPLENYDRHEDLERGKSDTRNRTESTTENQNREYSETGDVTTNEETERKVAAFNTSTYAPADQTNRDSRTQTETGGTTEGTTTGSLTGTEAGNENEHAINYIHGNVGVTTTQAMFLEELNLLGGFNAYQFIAEMFSKDLMLSIW